MASDPRNQKLFSFKIKPSKIAYGADLHELVSLKKRVGGVLSSSHVAKFYISMLWYPKELFCGIEKIDQLL